MRNRFTLILVLASIGGMQQSRADLLFALNPAGLQGLPGQTLTFNATLTNDGSDPIFLNGDNASISGGGLIIDDSLFFNNFPISLLGGDAASADIFTVAIGSLVPSGNHFGSFTIRGGADANAQEVQATQNFLVSVAPEPGLFSVLTGIGSAGSLFALCRLRRRK